MGVNPTTCVVIFVFIVSVSANVDQSRWLHPKDPRRVSGGFPLLPGFEGFEAEVLSLPKEELLRLQNAMKRIPFKGTPLELINDVATSAKNPEFDPEEIIYSLMKPENWDIEDHDIEGLLQNRRENTISSLDGINLDPDEEDIPEPEDRVQTQGYEGCFADYDAYIGPLAEHWFWEWKVLFDNPLLPPGPEPLEPPSWASSILDSNGKRPTGLYQGRMHWVGAVEECALQAIQHNVSIDGQPETRIFKGKYARLGMPTVWPNMTVPGMNITQLSSVVGFALGVCVPDTCSKEDVRRYIMNINDTGNPILGSIIQGNPLFFADGFWPRNITEVYFGQDNDFHTDKAAKAAIGIMLAGLIIIVFATCYDGWGRHRVIRKKIKKYVTGSTDGSNKPLTMEEVKFAKRFLYQSPGIVDKMEIAFAGYSMYSNLRLIFSTKLPHRKFHVPAIDGIRVLTLLWLMSGLSFVYGVVYFECWTTNNLLSALQHYTKEWGFMSILRVYHANHALFFVSGFVCVQMWYKAFHRAGDKVTFGLFIKYIIGRWLSIMPPIMGMLMIYVCLGSYISEGPMNPVYIQDARNCRSTWWITFLFFHNVIRTDEQCFAWTYMFASVWQLNLVSIFILIPLVLAPVAAYVLMALMWIAHIVVTAIWEVKVYDGEKSWFMDVVQTPWCNAGPYVIGMMFAIINRNSKNKWNTPGKRAGIFFLWLFSIAALMICIYAPWDEVKPEGEDWSKGGQVAFEVIAPQMFALALGWITYACDRGLGGVVGNLVNWRAFTVLGKLALPTTVFMAPAMTSYFYGRLEPWYITESHMSHLYYGHLIRIFMFAMFCALFFYYPITKSMKVQAGAETRLEIYLHCRHPEILDALTGDKEEDQEFWDAYEENEKAKKLLEEGPSLTATAAPRKKPLYGRPDSYVECVDDVTDIVGEFTPGKPPSYGRNKVAPFGVGNGSTAKDGLPLKSVSTDPLPPKPGTDYTPLYPPLSDTLSNNIIPMTDETVETTVL